MYGDNSRVIREQLSILLRQHRIQHRIGGPGVPTLPATATPAQRRLTGLQIRRYRHAVLVWSLEAARAVDPRPELDPRARNQRNPLTQLIARLEDTARASGPRPSIDELHSVQRYPMLRSWQQAARAATLGEHDFGDQITFASLTRPQARTILIDAATVIKAVVILDDRYAAIPGWRPFPHSGRLTQTAEACLRLAAGHRTDLTVDLRGWRHHPKLLDGPARSGLDGVLQAHHNLLIHLQTIPDALALRRIIESQQLVSRAVAHVDHADPDLRRRATRRSHQYRELQRLTRDLAGRAGPGGPATTEAYLAAVHAGRLTTGDLIDPNQVNALERSFTCLDARISQIIVAGDRENLYLQRVPVPEIDLTGPGLVKTQTVAYVPLRAAVDTSLLTYARDVLRPPRRSAEVPASSRHSRVQLAAALEHRPGHHDSGPAIAL